MSNEGEINYLLSMQVLCNQSKGWSFVFQEKFSTNVLHEFNMINYHLINTPLQGSI
jgi:hypothetical protein